MSEGLSPTARVHADDNLYDHASSLAKIERVFPPGKRLKVFDVGCGDGRLSRALVQRGHAVTGIDSNQAAVEAARQSGLEAQVADVEAAWPADSATQDVVLILDVLEHVVGQERVLAEAKRVLKPGGALIVAYPNEFDVRSRFELFLGRGIVHWDHRQYDAKPWSYGHVRFLRHRDLSELLERSGFGITKVQFNFMGGGLVPRRLLPPVFRRWLTRSWPELFSGKFVIRATPGSAQRNPEKIVLSKTPKGL